MRIGSLAIIDFRERTTNALIRLLGCSDLSVHLLFACNKTRLYVFGTRDLFNISYSRELYLFSKFLHFEEIVHVKLAVCFEMIVSET